MLASTKSRSTGNKNKKKLNLLNKDNDDEMPNPLIVAKEYLQKAYHLASKYKTKATKRIIRLNKNTKKDLRHAADVAGMTSLTDLTST